MKIEEQYQRFVENYDFNERLALETEKPHLARWAYGACEEWIRDFQGDAVKTITLDTDLFPHYSKIVGRKKMDLEELKQKLREKFSDNEILMEMLK